jgi:hypothetical protein
MTGSTTTSMKRLWLQSGTYFYLPDTVAAPRPRTVENMIYWEKERREREAEEDATPRP